MLQEKLSLDIIAKLIRNYSAWLIVYSSMFLEWVVFRSVKLVFNSYYKDNFSHAYWNYLTSIIYLV